MGRVRKEIGGYLELDECHGARWHEEAVALNCGRACLAYLIHAKNIHKMCVPFFLCNTVSELCMREGVSLRYYDIQEDFLPIKLELEEDEWLLLVNYYGQIANPVIEELVKKYERVIVDSTHAYFQLPLDGIDTFYSCRKFFGVPDGGLLYTNTQIDMELEQDYSYQRMNHILGRFEKDASSFYNDYLDNNKLFSEAPILRMSKLTDNLLRTLDYAYIRERRTTNFKALDGIFREKNLLNLRLPEGAFMYPLWVEDGEKIRQELIQRKIYIPLLWGDVLKKCSPSSLEYEMARNILPLPVDQRYDVEDMHYLGNCIQEILSL